MTAPVANDVFKFLALRPPQRVSVEETRWTIIRDPRVSEPDGPLELASMARGLARPEDARARWLEMDRSQLAALVDAYPPLVRRFEKLKTTDPTIDGRKILHEAGLSKRLDDPRVSRLAWEALYVADSTGADAGPRLEGPMAALRVLNLAALVEQQASLTRGTALEALRATPAIPHAFYDARIEAARLTVASTALTPPVVLPAPSPTGGTLRAQTLAQELAATDRLLRLVTTAPAGGAPIVTASVTTPQQSGWYRSEFRLGSAPTVRSVLMGRLSADASLLDELRLPEGASVATAAQSLQDHLTALNRQAVAFASDPDSQSQLRDLSLTVTMRSAALELDRGDALGAVHAP